MVYVVNKDGKPLMPTERHGKVRRLLKEHKAIVIKKVPFTIQLLYETTEFIQPITLGVDSGISMRVYQLLQKLKNYTLKKLH